jgi:hypothetical protein
VTGSPGGLSNGRTSDHRQSRADPRITHAVIEALRLVRQAAPRILVGVLVIDVMSSWR